jgi:hypothetical protein
MKRQWDLLRGEEGTIESKLMAHSLSGICDEEFVRALLEMKATLDRFGGWFHIQAFRDKFDADGNRVGKDETGTWDTIGYVFYYQNFGGILDTTSEPDARFEAPQVDPRRANYRESRENGSREEVVAD